MADRTALTKTTALGMIATNYGAGEAELTLDTADSVNGNSYVCSGNDLIVAYNPTEGALTLTVSSVANAYGRSGDITEYSIPAGEHAVFGPFKTQGWRQSDGNVYLTPEADDLLIAVIALP